MSKIVSIFIIAWLAVVSCSENKPSSPPPEVSGNLRLYFVDSFHIGDSTSALQAVVNYNLSSASGLTKNDSSIISSQSQVGQIVEDDLSQIPSGDYLIRYYVTRPFIILSRKDNTEQARFTDSATVTVPRNAAADAAPIDIWAYRLNRLIVYFDNNIAGPIADSLMQSVGVEVLGRFRSMFGSSLFYEVSTENAGPESELKPEIEALPGVNNVFFNIYGHSYF